MNNSFLTFEEDAIVDTTVLLRERKIKATKIVEAINELSKHTEWRTLKELVFDGLVEGLEKRLKVESQKNELNAPEIYRLQGKLEWARRYSDIYKLAEAYKVELDNITKKLNENATI